MSRLLLALPALLAAGCSLTRPEESACLKGFTDRRSPGYERALELIRKGQRSLLEHPRCDMPGFVPCAAHREQLEFLQERQRIEARNRRAIISGDKVYDSRVGQKPALSCHQ